MKNVKLLPLSVIFFCGYLSYGQQKKEDSIKTKNIEQVVISGNTFLQKAKNVPIPIEIISKKQIEQSGSRNLGQVLQEQSGLVLVQDHGTGLQMQGLNSEYTLVLVNGQPLIDRVPGIGTLDLSRISINNIKRIEVVRGPSSSLYGSDAIAGVVNIITEDANTNSGSIYTRIGKNYSYELNGDLNVVKNNFSGNFMASRYSTNGFKVKRGSGIAAFSTPPYQSYTYSGNMKYKFSDKFSAELYSKMYLEHSDEYNTSSQFGKYDEISNSLNYTIAPTLSWTPNSRVKSVLRAYITQTSNKGKIEFLDRGTSEDTGSYTENYKKIENFTNIKLNDRVEATVGIGGILQDVTSPVFYENKKHQHQYYGLAQIGYKPINRWNIQVGFRFDKNSAYGSQFNPKLAMDFKATDWLTLRASAGRGFKAPDFGKLYLNFSNPSNGYSVFGVLVLKDKLNELASKGLISNVIIQPETLEASLKAENSWAFNFGGTLSFFNTLKINASVFRNNIENFINAVTVAQKTNTKYVFSYRNMDKIFTQGIEAELNWNVCNSINFSGGYQYLEAKSPAVLDKIKQRKLYGTNDKGQLIRIKEKNYFGIPSRSKHTFNAKVFYHNKIGTFVNLRGIYRGPYGFADLDGNGIINKKSELAPGYFLLNGSVGQKFWNKFTTQLSVDNILNYRNDKYNPELLGRLYWVTLKMEF